VYQCIANNGFGDEVMREIKLTVGGKITLFILTSSFDSKLGFIYQLTEN